MNSMYLCGPRRDVPGHSLLPPAVQAEDAVRGVCGTHARLRTVRQPAGGRGAAPPAPGQGRAHRLPAEEHQEVPWTSLYPQFFVSPWLLYSLGSRMKEKLGVWGGVVFYTLIVELKLPLLPEMTIKA